MITGFKKTAHIGITVPDIQEAAAFFTEIFDGKVIGEGYNFQSEDNWMKDQLDVHPRTRIDKIQMIQLPDDSVIELFQYQSQDQNTVYPKNSDIGGHHISFEVENIIEAIAYLKEKNIEVLGDYTYNAPSWENINGTKEGMKWVFFKTPWGLSLELSEAK
ncbi:VOC family protein [Psychromonas aquimarina]|uniref:VOC family protein n=1 Tax=Psychromonas aquimarina TaxID=444919 RepID=UPI0004093FD9|nr:VOC family protein [Psychromonas aquimarina]